MGAESSTMQNSAATTACSGCKNLGNRTTDTVKVDLENMAAAPAAAPALGDNKENSDPRPAQMLEKVAESRKLAEQEEFRKQEEEAKRRAEEEENKRREREQLEAKRRKEAEEEQAAAALKVKEEEERRIQEEQRARAAEEAERLRKLEEEERMRRIQQEQEEEARRLQKEEEEAAEERKRKEEEEAAKAKQEQLRVFLEKTGFNSATEKKVKKGMMKMSSSFSYPLHAAVEQKDAEAVQVLLWAGADPSQANSKKQTPFQLAQAKNNKQGSHAKVMAALAA